MGAVVNGREVERRCVWRSLGLGLVAELFPYSPYILPHRTCCLQNCRTFSVRTDSKDELMFPDPMFDMGE